MLQIMAMKMRLAFMLRFYVAFLSCAEMSNSSVSLRGAETLPAHRWEVYQFVTLGEGKSEGTYYGTHFETEAEYGLTRSIAGEPFACPTLFLQ